MTNVIRKIGLLACFFAFLVCGLPAQEPARTSSGPAEALYLQLRSVGLDKTRVYKVREGSLDRGDIHLSLDDGTIAFTQSVDGHVTGALFLGDGEVLLSPPQTAERASLVFFTGAAILEEKISFAYLRFDAGVYEALRPALRPADDPDSFVSLWQTAAQEFAQEDALRLMVGFSQQSSATAEPHLLHAFLRGRSLGQFDIRYDSMLPEQMSAGQHTKADGVPYYNVWCSYSPATSNLGKEHESRRPLLDFDITRTKISAEIKPPTELSARAELTIHATRGGSRVLLFELSRLLKIQSVQVNGQPVEFIHNQAIEGSELERRGNDALAVLLATPLQAGQTITLTFQYSGTVLSEAADGLLYVGEHGTWYPNTGFAMCWFDLEFRFPIGWTLVATGKRTESKIEGGEQVSHWTSERAVPVAGFNLGKFSKATTRDGDVTVNIYATARMERDFAQAGAEPTFPDVMHPPSFPMSEQPLVIHPSPSRNLGMVGNTAVRALDFYQQRFGPYPYGELSLTQFPGQISQGWPGLVFLSSYAFLSASDNELLRIEGTDLLMQQQTIAHEIAHQWWGDLVSWDSYRDQWIMEALANYSALMLLESKNPGQFRELMHKYRDDLLATDGKGATLTDAGPVTFGVRLSSSRFPQGYQAISYGRGTWLLHMLRCMLRDSERRTPGKTSREEPFLQVLRRISKEYAGKELDTEEFIAAFQSELPRSLWYEGRDSLDWFYQSWVNGSAVPRFGLQDLKFADRGTKTIASGTIIQENAPEALVTAVPLYAVAGGKNVFLGRVFAEGRESSFRISCPIRTRKLLLDPEQTLLSRR